MHTSHEFEQKSDDNHGKKIVRFSSDKIDRQSTVRTYEEMKRGFLKLLASNQLEKIKEHYDSYTPDEIEKFYNEQGDSLFSWSIIDASSVNPLRFLIGNISPPIIQDILQANNFSILRIFLGIQKSREEIGYFPEEKKRLAMEKINSILQISSPMIVGFVNENTPACIKQELEKNACKLK